MAGSGHVLMRRTFVRTYGKVPADWSFAWYALNDSELRVDEDLLQRIDDWMEQTGRASSRSDALRQLADIGLGTMTGRTVHLSAGDMLNFMLLRDIAEHLKVPTETDARPDGRCHSTVVTIGHRPGDAGCFTTMPTVPQTCPRRQRPGHVELH